MNTRPTKRTRSASHILRDRYHRDAARQAEYEQTSREMALGEKIRSLREERGWTQQDLADAIGTQRSAISRLEDADYDGHSLSTLRKVAAALGMILLIDFAPQQDGDHPAAKML